jgi:hypothetical protein
MTTGRKAEPLNTQSARAPLKKTEGKPKAERLVCRYCGSDDLAPSFIKRRDPVTCVSCTVGTTILALLSSDHRERFTEVDLRMPRIVAQRHEHLTRRSRRSCT